MFQQDNAISHTAKVTGKFIRGSQVAVYPWPAKSLDLSLIKHVSNMRARSLSHFASLITDLRYIRHEWRNCLESFGVSIQKI